ncbi:MAG: rod shape-determining protein MreD [Proteobacteria bacterium]|nr:rod shape-determining protein MreD [Pseudomonadota bacterium]
MSNSAIKDYIVIYITLLLGMILTILPMPPWAVWLRPNWMLAILIFWLMTTSNRVGVGIAWFMGLWMDLLTGSLLGQQALIFTITAYLVLRFQQWISRMPVLQQTAIIFLLILFDLIIERCMGMLFQQTVINWMFWLPAVTTAVIWPWLSGLLYLYQIKLRVVEVG